LWASFFLATSFWHLNFSRIGLRAIAARHAFWCGVVAAGALRAKGGWRPEYSIPSGARGSSVWARLPHLHCLSGDPLLIGGVLVYYFFRACEAGRLAGFWKLAVLFAGSATTDGLPLIAYFVQHPSLFAGRSSQVSILNGPNAATNLIENLWKTAQMFWIAGDPNWRHNYDSEREVYWRSRSCSRSGW